MPNIKPSVIGKEIPRWLYEWLRRQDVDLSSHEQQLSAITRGEAPNSGGLTIAGTVSHHKLLDLTNFDDHPQYAFLKGRAGGQVLNGGAAPLSGTGVWTNAGNFTSKANKTSISTWSGIAIDTSASIGDVVIVLLATLPFAINLNNITAFHSTFTDTKGNSWTKKIEFSFSDNVFNGATYSVWMSTITSALTAGVDTLTATFTSAIGAQAISSHRWTGSLGTPVIAGLATLGEQGFVGNEPSPMTLAGLATPVQYLFIRASSKGAAGGSAVNPYTTSSNYTAFDNGTSFTSGGVGNVGSFGEYRILSASTDLSNPVVGSGGDYASIYFAIGLFPAPSGSLVLASANTNALAAKISLVNQTITMNADFINFQAPGGTTTLSFIRTTDGAFVGPVVTASQHLLNINIFDDVTAGAAARGDLITGQMATPKWTKLAIGTANQILHSDGTDVSWVTPGTDPVLATFDDSFFRIYNHTTPSKLIAFDASGITAANTRTLTVPDVSGTLILSVGPGIGQKIGSGFFPTGSTGDDLVITGRLAIGSPSSFTANQLLRISSNPTATGVSINQMQTNMGLSQVGTVSAVSFQAFLAAITGGSSITGGSPNIRGARFQVAPSFGAGAQPAEVIGFDFLGQVTLSTSGSCPLIAGIRANVTGGASTGDTYAFTNLDGITITASSTTAKTQQITGIDLNIDFASNKIRNYVGAIYGINLDEWPDHGGLGGSTVCTGTTSIGSPTVTSALGFNTVGAGCYITSTAFADPTYIVSIVGNTITMSTNATAAGGQTINVWGTAGVLAMIHRGQSVGLGGDIIACRFIDNQSLAPSQHKGPFYFNPTTPSAYTQPTASIHIGGVSTAAASAPIKFDSGTLMTTPEAGAIEFVTDDLYLTITTGAARKGFILNDGTKLTSGTIPVATTNGRIKDLPPIAIGASAVFVANTSGIVNDSATWDGWTIGQAIKALRNQGILA